MNRILCVFVTTLLLISPSTSPASDAKAKSAEDAIQNVVKVASDLAFDAGWCSAMTSLGLEIGKDKSGELGELLRNYVLAELAARDISGKDELTDYCLKATGRSKLFTTALGKKLGDMKSQRAASED